MTEGSLIDTMSRRVTEPEAEPADLPLVTPARRELATLVALGAELGRADRATGSSPETSAWFMARFETFLESVRAEAANEVHAVIATASRAAGPAAPAPAPAPLLPAPATTVAAPEPVLPAAAPLRALQVTPSPVVDRIGTPDGTAEGVDDEVDHFFWRDDEVPWSGRLPSISKARLFQGAGIAAAAVAALVHFS